MSVYVLVCGEELIGDGYSLLYRNGELVKTIENSDYADGYLAAVTSQGHDAHILDVELEGSDLEWDDVDEWWESAGSRDNLNVLISKFTAAGFTQTLTDVEKDVN